MIAGMLDADGCGTQCALCFVSSKSRTFRQNGPRHHATSVLVRSERRTGSWFFFSLSLKTFAGDGENEKGGHRRPQEAVRLVVYLLIKFTILFRHLRNLNKKRRKRRRLLCRILPVDSSFATWPCTFRKLSTSTHTLRCLLLPLPDLRRCSLLSR